MTIIGAIIACVALSLSTIAPNIETLMLSYGVVGGIGFGMIYLPAIVSVGYYFTTKRAFATGVAVCGSGVGTFLFAPIVQAILSVTSWQNTLLILATLVLCCGFVGLLMKPLEIHASAVVDENYGRCDGEDEEEDGAIPGRKPLLQRIAEEKRRRLLAHSNSQFLLMMQQNESQVDVNDAQFNELKARLMLNNEPGVHSTLYLDQLFGRSHAQTSSPGTTPTPSMTPSIGPSVTNSVMTLERHQLSPIIERKFPESDDQNLSGDNSAEALNQLTVTTVIEVNPNKHKLQDIFSHLKSSQTSEENEDEGDAGPEEQDDENFEDVEFDDFRSLKSETPTNTDTPQKSSKFEF